MRLPLLLIDSLKTVVLLTVMLGSAQATAIQVLDEYQVMPINSAIPIEPSGLTIRANRLFTVCDDGSQIYLIDELSENLAEAKVYQDLDISQLAALNLDLEGITVVGDEFFLVSENHSKLVRVNGTQLHYVPDLGGVYANAFQAGLFQLDNAGLESAAYLGNQTFLMSVERQPRGLIEVTFDENFNHIIKQTNQMFDDSTHPLESHRKPDLTGLFYYDGVIYALHRNAYLIHELVKQPNGEYQEGQVWSYEHIVRDPAYAYQDMTFGHAEGLAVDDQYFYLVLDNNRSPRLVDDQDIRPLLIKAKRK